MFLPYHENNQRSCELLKYLSDCLVKMRYNKYPEAYIYIQLNCYLCVHALEKTNRDITVFRLDTYVNELQRSRLGQKAVTSKSYDHIHLFILSCHKNIIALMH